MAGRLTSDSRVGMWLIACRRLGRVQIRTRVSIIESLTPPLVIGLDVLRHCQCDVSFKSNVLVLRSRDPSNGAPIEEVVPFCMVKRAGAPKTNSAEEEEVEEDDEGGGGGGGGNVSMAGV